MYKLASPSMRLIKPIYFCSKSITNPAAADYKRGRAPQPLLPFKTIK